MSEVSREFSAKNVEAAIEEGLRALNVRRQDVEIDVLHEGSRGLLGIGGSNARIRITIPAPEPAPAPEPKAVQAAPVETSDEPASKQDDTADTAANIKEAGSDAPESKKAEAEKPEVAKYEDTDSSDQPSADQSEDAESAVAEEEMAEAQDKDEDDLSIAGDELEELAASLLHQMLSLMGYECEIEAGWQDDDSDTPPLVLNVLGSDLGILIGRHGETLASIQYLIRLMVNQRIHRWTNIVVDVDGYKERRAEQVQQMAERLAQQVIESGRALSLEPMPANERRLVHIALRDNDQVYTQSTGEGERRKVQIIPES